MTIPEVSGAGATKGTVSAKGDFDPKSMQGVRSINMQIPETEECKNAKKRIENAKYQLTLLKAQVQAPKISEDEKKELQSKIDKLQNVYDNTTYTIDSFGNVLFVFKGYVNAKDFVEAYGIVSGSLQNHLRIRHDREGEQLQIIGAEIHKDGKVASVNDYDNSTPAYIGVGYTDDPFAKIEYDFTNGGRGSYIEYSDGMIVRQVKTFWGGTSPQNEYDGMALRSGETVELSLNQLESAE